MGSDHIDLEAVRHELPVLDRYAYLNTGTFGPLPRTAVEAMQTAERRELEEGRSSRIYFQRVLYEREALRAELAGLLGTQPERVALTSSTTEGCNIVLRGLGIAPGDEVVTTDSEHPGLFGGLVASGATLHIAAIRERPTVEILPTIQAQITPRTRLIAISHVSWLDGAILPVRELAGHGAPVLVDGAQGAGAIPVNVEELGADYYTVSAQKWILGPSGTGALYIAPGRLEDCRVTFPSYLSWNLPNYEFRDGAARFDGSWTPAASIAGLRASLSFAAKAGEERFERARQAAELCRTLLLEYGAEVITEPDQATLVSWRTEDPEALVDRLADQRVVVRDLPGTGMVRAACGYWTSEDDLERLIRALALTHEPTEHLSGRLDSSP
jgi:L-cysteine/cystine lyase